MTQKWILTKVDKTALKYYKNEPNVSQIGQNNSKISSKMWNIVGISVVCFSSIKSPSTPKKFKSGNIKKVSSPGLFLLCIFCLWCSKCLHDAKIFSCQTWFLLTAFCNFWWKSKEFSRGQNWKSWNISRVICETRHAKCLNKLSLIFDIFW